MHKSVVDAQFMGVSKHHGNVKTGIFAVMAATGLRLRVNHKKIASRRLLVSRACTLRVQARHDATGEAKVIVVKKGALPLFVESQKLGAGSWNK